MINLGEVLAKIIDRIHAIEQKIGPSPLSDVFVKKTGDTMTGNLTVPTVIGNCSGSSGSCTGNAATATKATGDGNGNNIATSLTQLGNSIENRGWNQLVKNGNFVDTSNWDTSLRVVLTVSNNVASVSPAAGRTTTDNYAEQTIYSMVAGHKYLYSVDTKGHTAHTCVMRIYHGSASNHIDEYCSTANVWEHKEGIFTCAGTTYRYVRLPNYQLDTTKVNQFKNFMLVDLTALYGSGNEPTTASDFRKLYPQAYYPYGGIEADYVIEEGINNNWTYKKWNSGKIECYQTNSVTITNWYAWGGMYESNEFTAPANPSFSFVTTKMHVSVIPWGTETSNPDAYIGTPELMYRTTGLVYYLLRGTNGNVGRHADVTFYLEGTV